MLFLSYKIHFLIYFVLPFLILLMTLLVCARSIFIFLSLLFIYSSHKLFLTLQITTVVILSFPFLFIHYFPLWRQFAVSFSFSFTGVDLGNSTGPFDYTGCPTRLPQPGNEMKLNKNLELFICSQRLWLCGVPVYVCSISIHLSFFVPSFIRTNSHFFPF